MIEFARPSPDRLPWCTRVLLRKVAERTVDTLWARIAQILDAFTPHEYANYLANAGDGSY
jgi:hypothetical protein